MSNSFHALQAEHPYNIRLDRQEAYREQLEAEWLADWGAEVRAWFEALPDPWSPEAVDWQNPRDVYEVLHENSSDPLPRRMSLAWHCWQRIDDAVEDV